MSRKPENAPLTTTAARNFLLIKTDLFLCHQRDEDIGKWFLGGDCAGWFYVRLLLHNSIQRDCEPVMEDWGWTFSIHAEGVRVVVDVWDFFGIENCWLLGVTPKNRLFFRHSADTTVHSKNIVCNALENISKGEARISKHRWFAENPFDLQFEQF